LLTHQKTIFETIRYGTNKSNKIDFAFENLRASLLFMLFIGHVSLSYLKNDIGNLWYYSDHQQSIIFDGVASVTTVVLMPIYFLITGYFTQKSMSSYSKSEVIYKRTNRILRPFILTFLTIIPLSDFIGEILNDDSSHTLFSAIENSFARYHWSFSTGHVWFLYYLIIFSIIQLQFLKEITKISIYLKPKTHVHLAGILIVLMLLLTGILHLENSNTLLGSYSLLPSIYSLMGFGIFYLIGIFLFQYQSNNATFSTMKWPLLIIGLVFLTINNISGYKAMQNSINPTEYNMIMSFSFATASICLSLSIIWLAQTYFQQTTPFILFISKSSYFVYLIHLPFILIWIYICSDVEMNAIYKFFIVLIGSISSSFGVNYLRLRIQKTNP